jgi:hypothetical protein
MTEFSDGPHEGIPREPIEQTKREHSPELNQRVQNKNW